MSISLDAGLVKTPCARPAGLGAKAWRYGLSTSGPVATSAAHFLASLLFVRALAAAPFGLFSFVMVAVPFAMSMAGALLVIPVTRALGEAPAVREAVTASCMKLNLLLSFITAACVFALLRMAHAAPLAALLLGLFGGAFTYRWFGRCQAFVEGRLTAAVLSDLLYATLLAIGLSFLAFTHRLTLISGGAMLLLAATASLAPLGRAFFAGQFHALRHGRLGLYRGIFRDVTRWSLLGVIFTEMTVNAHAYLVTFLAGPGSFALLALGMLLLRPASLVQSALPDLERPVMTRQIAAGDFAALKRTKRDFGIALLGALAATLVLDLALLTQFPSLLLKKGYGLNQVFLVGTLSAIIMAVRALRTPLATQLQAAGAFRPMARLGMFSSAISLLSTLALLLAFGPIASLGGVLLGELVILLACHKLARDCEANHG